MQCESNSNRVYNVWNGYGWIFFGPWVDPCNYNNDNNAWTIQYIQCKASARVYSTLSSQQKFSWIPKSFDEIWKLFGNHSNNIKAEMNAIIVFPK